MIDNGRKRIIPNEVLLPEVARLISEGHTVTLTVRMLNGHFQEQPPNSLSPLLPPVPSAVASGNGEKIPGGLLSDMEPELNYVPRYPRLLKPDKKKCRRRYGRQD